MAVKKAKAEPKAEPKVAPKVALKEKIPAANIAQAGIIRALKTRGFSLAKDMSPYEFTDPKTAIQIIIHPDKAVVENTKISVPLGKGAIHELMKQIEALGKK